MTSPDKQNVNCTLYEGTNQTNVTFPPLDYTLAETYKVTAGTVVFLGILPFVLFYFPCFPIGATAAILMGAILMVATTVISQDEFYTILGEPGNLRTIFLLLGMMIISQYFEREQLIQNLLGRMLPKNLSFATYLWRTNLLTFIIAALFTNDAACVIITPLILKHWKLQERPVVELETLLLAIATSANIGSVVTIFGNPQMALIASTTEKGMFQKSQLSLLRSVTFLGPPAVVAYFINLGFLRLHFKWKQSLGDLDEYTPILPPKSSTEETNATAGHPAFKHVVVLTLIGMLILFFVQTNQVKFDIGILPMGASALLMTADAILNRVSPSNIIMRTDWSVILMFFALFVWLGGVNATRAPRAIWKAIGLAGRPINDALGILILSVFVILGSNVFSNVPLTIIVLEQLEPCVSQLALVLYLAWCSTIAGNLTLFGSVANIIVAQKARETLNFSLTFWGYLRYGFLTTLIIVTTGITIIYGLLQL